MTRWRAALGGLLLAGCIAPGPGDGTGDVERRFDAVRVGVRVGPGGLELTSATYTLEPPSGVSPDETIGALTIEDAAGRAIATVEVPPPDTVSVIHELEAGGDAARSDTVTLVVPWPDDAHRVSTGGGGLVPQPPAAAAGAAMPAPTGDAAVVGPDTLPGAQAIHMTGPPERRFDFVVVGSGYGAAGSAQFLADARRFADALLAMEPYRTLAERINVWAVPTAGGALSCNHGCHGIDRLICCDDAAAFAVARSAVEHSESVLVLVDSESYGGSGGNVAISYNGPHMESVMLHELGHTLGLDDEYVYAGADASVYDVQAGVNCADADPPHWDHWLDAPGVGAFGGCRFENLFRPTHDDCLMRKNEVAHYCPVCREHVTLRIYAALGGLVESATPEPAMDEEVSIGGSPTRFELTADTVGDAKYEWVLDHAVTGADGPRFDVSACAVDDRALLTVTVTDQLEFVRRDPQRYLTDSVRWSLAADPDAATGECLPMCIGAACDVGTPCCDASLICQPSAAGSPTGACRAIPDARCGTSDHCLGAMQCVDGVCQCQPLGATCETHRECCGGAFCSDGVCAFD